CDFHPARYAGGRRPWAGGLKTHKPQTTVLGPPGTPLWQSTHRNFAPRVGVAYRLTKKGDFVMRAGWGIFYDLGNGTVANLGQFFPNNGRTVAGGSPLPLS